MKPDNIMIISSSLSTFFSIVQWLKVSTDEYTG